MLDLQKTGRLVWPIQDIFFLFFQNASVIFILLKERSLDTDH